jgi:cytochrome c oxidase subunit 1
MPRRIPDYSTQFTDFNTIASIGAIGFGLSQLIFVLVLLTAKKGAKADERVWEGAHGLEWTVPSPAPWHTFTTPPKARIANEAFE